MYSDVSFLIPSFLPSFLSILVFAFIDMSCFSIHTFAYMVPSTREEHSGGIPKIRGQELRSENGKYVQQCASVVDISVDC